MSNEGKQVELAQSPQRAMFPSLGLNFLLLQMDGEEGALGRWLSHC